nr:hypothetical protein TVY486_1006660 [Trypanosoma vivax Y486]
MRSEEWEDLWYRVSTSPLPCVGSLYPESDTGMTVTVSASHPVPRTNVFSFLFLIVLKSPFPHIDTIELGT